MKVKRKHSPLNQSGVTMLQFALTFPVLILIIFSMIDICRYYTIQTMLTSAVFKAANKATRVHDLDIKTKGLSSSSPDYGRYFLARDKVMHAAESAALVALVTDSAHPSDATLLKVRTNDEGVSGATDVESHVAFLRPGDKTTFLNDDGTTEDLFNKFVGRLSPSDPVYDDPAYAMEKAPLVVEMRAKVKFITPFFGSKVITARALNYRPRIPRELTAAEEAALAGTDGDLTVPPPVVPEAQPSPTPDLCASVGKVYSDEVRLNILTNFGSTNKKIICNLPSRPCAPVKRTDCI